MTPAPAKEELLALAAKVEGHSNRFQVSMETQAAFLAAFDLEQRHYDRAGWKIIYPSGRPGSALRPIGSLDDLHSVAYWSKIPLPSTIPSDPIKAAAAYLRARAEAAQSHISKDGNNG